jgi:hypothetical protein
MKKVLLVFKVIFMITAAVFGAEKKNMQERKWFDTIGCEKMRIAEYKSASEKSVVREQSITDAPYIKSMQLKISQLPTEGQMMVKMGPEADYLTLEFICGPKTEVIQFFNHHIKTPATSFFDQNEKGEQDLWKEIQSHFAKPEYNIAVPKVTKVNRDYDDFLLEYLGSEDRTPKGTSASAYVESFKVTAKSDHSVQIVEVHSGQLPPRPTDFSVGKKLFTVMTFRTSEQQDLNPRKFVVIKK